MTFLQRALNVGHAKLAGEDAFKGRNPAQGWAWFVQATNKISPHDFDLMTRR